MAGLNCEIRWETRLCEVDGELGYFHCWEHWSNSEALWSEIKEKAKPDFHKIIEP